MAAISGTGHKSHNTLFDNTLRHPSVAAGLTVEQREALARLKARRARGVVEDDPTGIDTSADARYTSAKDNG